MGHNDMFNERTKEWDTNINDDIRTTKLKKTQQILFWLLLAGTGGLCLIGLIKIATSVFV